VSANELNAAERDHRLQDISFAIWGARPCFRDDCSHRTFVYRAARDRAIPMPAADPSTPPSSSAFEPRVHRSAAGIARGVEARRQRRTWCVRIGT